MKNKYRIVGDVVVIQLKYKKKRYYTHVDINDLDKLIEFGGTWYLKKGYVAQNKCIKGKLITFRLHRFLTNCPKGLEVDHKDKNPFNNRKSENLEIVTRKENMKRRWNKVENIIV